MLRILQERLNQGSHTMRYPDGPPPTLAKHFRGQPVISGKSCQDGCEACLDVCPTDAINLKSKQVSLDLGRCLFCGLCEEACPSDIINFSSNYRLATSSREDLVARPSSELVLAKKLSSELLRIFGRSLKLRQVSAAGCNACEADINVLGTIGWDIGRFGIQVVASPRHADGILVTGCVSENMRIGLQKSYDAVPAPKIVIALGACAISGGPFRMNPQQLGGAEAVVPVDLYIPGCPPHPITILDGLLRMLGRLEKDGRVNAAEKGAHLSAT